MSTHNEDRLREVLGCRQPAHGFVRTPASLRLPRRSSLGPHRPTNYGAPQESSLAIDFELVKLRARHVVAHPEEACSAIFHYYDTVAPEPILLPMAKAIYKNPFFAAIGITKILPLIASKFFGNYFRLRGCDAL